MPPTATMIDEPADIAELKAKAGVLIEEVRTISDTAEKTSRDFTAEERSTVKSKLDEARGLTDQAKRLKSERDGDVELRAAMDSLGGDLGLLGKAHPTSAERSDEKGRRKTLGELFVEDEAFKGWLKSVAPNGTIPESRKGFTSPPVGFRGLKDIVSTGTGGPAAALVAPDFRGLTDATGTFQRPLVIRDLVTGGSTTSDTVEYVRVSGFTNSAAAVAEASGTSAGTGSDDVTGSKPESDLELEKVTENVKTIAHWIPATKRALSDAAQVRTLIDNFLRYGLDEELEDNMVSGDGTGENFTGVLHTSGVQTLDDTAVTAVDDAAAGALAGIVALRIAKRLVRVNGRATATAYVLNPADNEKIDLARDANGNFYFGGPGGNGVSTAWGLPRVESEAVPEGTAIAADWRHAILWDREQAAISVSDSHADFFVRNLIAVLAELRAAFGIDRPAAFVLVDLDAIFGITVP